MITVAGVTVEDIVTGLGVKVTDWIELETAIKDVRHAVYRLTLVTTEVARGTKLKELQNDEAFAPRVLRSLTITSTMRHSSRKRDLSWRIAESMPESWALGFGMGLGVQLARLHRSSPAGHRDPRICIGNLECLRAKRDSSLALGTGTRRRKGSQERAVNSVQCLRSYGKITYINKH
jgi:hypothetical protein